MNAYELYMLTQSKGGVQLRPIENLRGAFLYDPYASIISSGFTIEDMTLGDGCTIRVYDSGIANRINQYGGWMHVSSGGIANSATVSSGGFLHVLSGGTASNAIVSSMGFLHVLSGGTASNAIVSSMGFMIVSSGGTALNTTSKGGASITVYSGGYITYAN